MRVCVCLWRTEIRKKISTIINQFAPRRVQPRRSPGSPSRPRKREGVSIDLLSDRSWAESNGVKAGDYRPRRLIGFVSILRFQSQGWMPLWCLTPAGEYRNDEPCRISGMLEQGWAHLCKAPDSLPVSPFQFGQTNSVLYASPAEEGSTLVSKEL